MKKEMIHPAIGKAVKVNKPLLVLLEKISVEEFLYLHNLSDKIGYITDVIDGVEGKSIYVVAYKNEIVHVEESDVRFLYTK